MMLPFNNGYLELDPDDDDVQVYEDGSVESPCALCGERLLFFKGDSVTIQVASDGNAYLLCTSCEQEANGETQDT